MHGIDVEPDTDEGLPDDATAVRGFCVRNVIASLPPLDQQWPEVLKAFIIAIDTLVVSVASAPPVPRLTTESFVDI